MSGIDPFLGDLLREVDPPRFLAILAAVIAALCLLAWGLSW